MRPCDNIKLSGERKAQDAEKKSAAKPRRTSRLLFWGDLRFTSGADRDATQQGRRVGAALLMLIREDAQGGFEAWQAVQESSQR